MITKIIKVESCVVCPYHNSTKKVRDICDINGEYIQYSSCMEDNEFPSTCPLENYISNLPVPKKIEIEYDGKYPNYCGGQLKVTIDGKLWVFKNNSLKSGGGISNNGDGYSVREGEWEIREWPDNFPEEYKKIVTDEVNSQIPYGCCGGCI